MYFLPPGRWISDTQMKTVLAGGTVNSKANLVCDAGLRSERKKKKKTEQLTYSLNTSGKKIIDEKLSRPD